MKELNSTKEQDTKPRTSFQGATLKNVSFRSESLWSNPMKSIHFDGAMMDKVTYAALNDLSKVTVLS